MVLEMKLKACVLIAAEHAFSLGLFYASLAYEQEDLLIYNRRRRFWVQHAQRNSRNVIKSKNIETESNNTGIDVAYL